MEKIQLHYVSNSGLTSESGSKTSIQVKEIVVFYFYFEWV